MLVQRNIETFKFQLYRESEGTRRFEVIAQVIGRKYEFMGLINDILGEYSMMNEVMERLLNEGSPSIAYRVKKEIKQEKLSKEEEQNYLDLIYAEPKVQMVLSWQNQDGYFGTRLHTAPSRSKVWTHEGCVRFLLEMGLTKECEKVRKALEVMTCPGWGKECENSRAAQVFKYEMIRASLYAQAGCQNDKIISKWVNDALTGFRHIAEAECYEDMVYESKDHKLIFKGDKYIPVIYHLRILAFTEFWRTKDNLEMLRTAYNKMYQWLPLPPIYYKSKGQLIAPLGNICGPANQNFKDEYGFFWFHFYELSARMGMLDSDSSFRQHFEELKKRIWEYGDKASELQIKRKDAYTGWSGYSGLALESQWQRPMQIMHDFMFRVMLIEKYCK